MTGGKELTTVCSMIPYLVGVCPEDFKNRVSGEITSIIQSNSFKILHILPGLIFENDFCIPLLENLLLGIVPRLDPMYDAATWNITFKSALSLVPKLLESKRADLAENLVHNTLKSTAKVVEFGMRDHVRKELEEWIGLMRENAEYFRHTDSDYVSNMIRMIKGTGEMDRDMKEDRFSELDKVKFGVSLALKTIFSGRETEIRESAIRCLYFLLLSSREKRKFIPSAIGNELVYAVVGCLEDRRLGNVFGFLSKIIAMLSSAFFFHLYGHWNRVQDFIRLSAQSDTMRSATLFRDLPFGLREELYRPSITALFPVILTRLEATDCLENWSLIYTTAFSLRVHFFQASDYDSGRKLSYAMRRSTEKLVEDLEMEFSDKLRLGNLSQVESIGNPTPTIDCLRSVKVISGKILLASLNSKKGDHKIPQLDFGVPIQVRHESWTKVENVLERTADLLECEKEHKRVDPEIAEAIDHFVSKVKSCVAEEISFISFIENPNAPPLKRVRDRKKRLVLSLPKPKGGARILP